MSSSQPFRVTKHGIELRVRLTPKSSRDQIGEILEIEGIGVLRVAVRALPQAGAANAALLALIAKSLRIPKTSIRLASGGKSRIKVLEIAGDPETLAANLDRIISRPT
ncbi:MAG: DUF167 family protein [Pseudomonadota bacterium]